MLIDLNAETGKDYLENSFNKFWPGLGQKMLHVASIEGFTFEGKEFGAELQRVSEEVLELHARNSRPHRQTRRGDEHGLNCGIAIPAKLPDFIRAGISGFDE